MAVNQRPLEMAPVLNGLSWLSLKPFNMRNATMANFVVNEKRPLYRAQALSVSRYREEYLTRDADKSVALLRQLVQEKINSEIDTILHNYYDLFFKPALCNIQSNLKDRSNSDLSDKKIFRDILQETLKNYSDCDPHCESLSARDNDQSPCTGQFQCHRTRGRPPRSKDARNKKSNSKLKQKLKSKSKHLLKVDEFDIDDFRWDPARLNTDSVFVLGSKANKALGFGAARGRLYSKHAHLFRYIGDQEDKEWLIRNQLMPAAGVKAYLLLKEDIAELILSKEYRDIPGVDLEELGEGFTVPQSILNKMVCVMSNMKKRLSNQKSVSEADFAFKGMVSELSTFDSDLSSSFESAFELVNNSTDNSQS